MPRDGRGDAAELRLSNRNLNGRIHRDRPRTGDRRIGLAKDELGVIGQLRHLRRKPRRRIAPPNTEHNFDDIPLFQSRKINALGWGKVHRHGAHTDDFAIAVFEVMNGFVMDPELRLGVTRDGERGDFAANGVGRAWGFGGDRGA